MSRRGVGIADMRATNLANGDMDLAQADQAGVYHVNCTHQVGIATSTEVGLSPDRFPIRVILAADAVSVPNHACEAVVSYWRLTTAAGASVPFSRKPLASDIAIKNIYKIFGSFDDDCWAAYETIRGATYNVNNDPEIDAQNVVLFPILQLQAPTAEQIVQATAAYREILRLAVAQNRAAYFQISELHYIRAEPHGRAYTTLGAMTASRRALTESALCLALNFSRLKAKYETIEDGSIAFAAYSIAAMFRHGLAESFEHTEYYTVIMTPTVNATDSYTVSSIRFPRGAPPPADITQGRVVSLAGIKYSKRMVELGNMGAVGSGLMHYLFNHTTGGTVVTGALLTTLVMNQLITADMPQEHQVAITSLLYEALHPSNKRAIANIFFKNSGVTTHGRCATFPRYERFQLDTFVQIRANPYPAGSHKAFICLQALKRVINAGLAPFLPWADQMSACIQTCRDVLVNGARSHIGSSYYTGEPPLAQPSSIDMYLPELAAYVHTFNRGDSLTMSPHMSDELSRRSSMNWQNLLRDLRAKDVSATSSDLVRSFLSTSGSVHFAFDPNDQATWAAAVQASHQAGQVIDNIFN